MPARCCPKVRRHPVDTLLSRLSRLFRDKHADILITRQNAAAVEFSFEDIHSAEFLEVGVTASINVRIGDAASFTQHFMAAPGCVTLTDVRGLLASAVRQVLADFIGALSLREMVGKSDLREKLSTRMLGALKERFAAYGLLVEGVESLSLRHDKFTQNRQVEGTLWLVADEQKLRLAHQRDLDQLYSEDEWRKIKHEEDRHDGDGCSDCRDAEELAASDRTELIEQLAKSRTRSTEDLAFATAFLANNISNPGDYICPYCKFKTLKEEASCCPRCQKNIENNYWDSICAPRRRAEAAKIEAKKIADEKWAKRGVIIGTAYAEQRLAEAAKLAKRSVIIDATSTERSLAEAAPKAADKKLATGGVVIGSACNVDYEEWLKKQKERISENDKKSWFVRLFRG